MRINESKRIMEENEKLLERLQNRQSNYNVFEWENKRKLELQDIKRICKFDPTPIISSQRTNTKSRKRGNSKSI